METFLSLLMVAVISFLTFQAIGYARARKKLKNLTTQSNEAFNEALKTVDAYGKSIIILKNVIRLSEEKFQGVIKVNNLLQEIQELAIDPEINKTKLQEIYTQLKTIEKTVSAKHRIIIVESQKLKDISKELDEIDRKIK